MTTQKDIARELGVSVSLVSRALSGKARAIGVPAETVARIRKTAGQLGYIPDATAQALQGARAMIIGGVIFDFEDPFVGPVVGELQRLAQASGYAMMLTGPEVETLVRYRLDGVVVVGSGEPGSWLDLLARRKVPMVRIGSGDVPDACGRVQVDHQAGVRALLGHLVDRGCRRIGFIGGHAAAHRERFQIFREQCAAHGVETRPDWWGISERPVSQAGQDAALRLLDQTGDQLPEAVMASSDAVAVGAYPVFAEAGIGLGSSLSLTGYDGLPLGELVTPSLTTVRQPVHDMVAAGFGWLRQAMESPPAPEQTVVLPPELIIRRST